MQTINRDTLDLSLSNSLAALCALTADDIGNTGVAYLVGRADWDNGTPDRRKPYGGELQASYEQGLNDAARGIADPRGE